VRVCTTRLGMNPALAGIKHLNRLEQVLASAEWDDPQVDEGLMLAMDGRLVCATAANVFVVRGGHLLTPEIRDCGVSGVMRGLVLEAARALHVPHAVEDLQPEVLAEAEEVFITNAVSGIRPVGEVLGVGRWPEGEVTRALATHLAGLDE